MRILICDDNSKMRFLLKVFLQDAAEVYECADGDQAVRAFSECKPDWVVMDVQMERVSGIVAARQLKNAFPSSRIVMLSKHNDVDIQAAACEAGASAYLVKDDLTALRRFLFPNQIH